MKRNLSKIFIIIISLFLVLPEVKAEENTNIVDFTRKGSISITLEDLEENLPIKEAEISLYHIANATEENHNLKFIYTEELKECEIPLTNLEDDTLASSLSNCIKDETTSIKGKSNEDGIAKFNDLDLGLYLVTQTNKVEGYSSFDSFLIMIPQIENNNWIYDLKASPKTEIYKVMNVIVSKVWNTNDNNIPTSIKVELYKEKELIDTISLNKENDWTHTWERIEKSDNYSVLEIDIPAGYTATYRKIYNKFIITNTKTLVQTGLKLWIIELLLISGFILIIGGIIFEKRKKYE